MCLRLVRPWSVSTPFEGRTVQVRGAELSFFKSSLADRNLHIIWVRMIAMSACIQRNQRAASCDLFIIR